MRNRIFGGRVTTVTENAYAKINLYLDVTSRRADGFHTVKSVMHTVSLSDTVEITAFSSEKTVLELSCLPSGVLMEDGDNLVLRAAKSYLEKAGIQARLKITLRKNIPLSAGLAGGSADAAATLRALNRLYENCLSDDELLSLAAYLGSDVPFCLVGGTALCEGRGEMLTPIDNNASLHLVIAKGEEQISTPTAYAALDRDYEGFDGGEYHGEEHLSELLSSLASGRAPTSLYNIFESVIEPTAQSITRIKSIMLECGALSVLMSGSGPSVFGIFEDTSRRTETIDALRSAGYFAATADSAP